MHVFSYKWVVLDNICCHFAKVYPNFLCLLAVVYLVYLLTIVTDFCLIHVIRYHTTSRDSLLSLYCSLGG